MSSFKILAALGLCAAIATGTARASDQSKDKAGVWDIHHQRTTTTVPRQQQPGVLDHGRIHDRRAPVVLNTAPANRPRGWEHGRKTGWGSCEVPPGHARPANCRPVHHDRRWVQRRDHRWEEHRERERREAHRRVERRHERIEIARRGRHDHH